MIDLTTTKLGATSAPRSHAPAFESAVTGLTGLTGIQAGFCHLHWSPASRKPVKSIQFTLIATLICVCLSTLGEEASLEDESFGKLRLGQSAEAVSLVLGKAESKGKETNWAATGDWVQEWRYAKRGVTLDMASEKRGGAKTVLSIRARPPCVFSTSRGIRLGSSEGEVRKAYGNVQDKDQSEPGRTFVAGSIYGGLIFTFEKGRVVEIFIGAAAE